MSEEGEGLGDGIVLEGNGIHVQDISTELAIQLSLAVGQQHDANIHRAMYKRCVADHLPRKPACDGRQSKDVPK